MIDSSPVRCLPSSCQIDRTSIRVRPEADVSFVPAFLPAKAKEKAVEEAGSFQVSSLLPLQMGACHSSMARFHTGCVKHIANSEPGSNLISLHSTHCPMWDDGIIYTIGIASIQLFIKNVMSLC